MLLCLLCFTSTFILFYFYCHYEYVIILLVQIYFCVHTCTCTPFKLYVVLLKILDVKLDHLVEITGTCFPLYVACTLYIYIAHIELQVPVVKMIKQSVFIS